MKKCALGLLLTSAICLLLATNSWSKTPSEYVPELSSTDLQTQAAAAKFILNHPREVPLLALEKAINIAGQQRLKETKQALILILKDTTYRGTTRALAANSLGFIAHEDPAGPNRSDIYNALISASYDPVWTVRMGACRALGNSGNKNAVPRLNEIFNADTDPRVQLYAGKAILELTGTYPDQEPTTMAATAMTAASTTPTNSTSTLPPAAQAIYQKIIEYITTYVKVQ